jgi:hypothetical protein
MKRRIAVLAVLLTILVLVGTEVIGLTEANPVPLPSVWLTTPSYSNPMQEFRSSNFTIRFEVYRLQNSINGIAINCSLDGSSIGYVPNTSLKEVTKAETLGGVYYIFDGGKELTNVANGQHNITINLETPEGNDSKSVLFLVNTPSSPTPLSTAEATRSSQGNLITASFPTVIIAITSMIILLAVSSLAMLYFKKDKKKGAVFLLVAIVVVTQLLGAVYYYYSINQKDTRLSELESQIGDLNNQIAHPKANLITGLGISDVAPGPTLYPYETLEFDYSHLWLTGWLLNSGAGIALNVKVIVLAYDNQNTLLFNETVPVSSSGLIMFPATLPSNGAHIPYTGNTNIYSQQNMTVRFGVYHLGFFPSNTTRYEVIPICDNI